MKALIMGYKILREMSIRINRIICSGMTSMILKMNGAHFQDVSANGLPSIHVSLGGELLIGAGLQLGNYFSTHVSSYSGRCHFEVRKGARLLIGSNVGMSMTGIFCHNSIVIGDNVKLGAGVHIYDTDFHSILARHRQIQIDDVKHTKTAPVQIGNNVFVGAHAIILKGATIGENSVIGAGSVVSRSIPANVIAAGNPCVVIRTIE